MAKRDLSQEYKVYLPLNLFTRIYHININKKKENRANLTVCSFERSNGRYRSRCISLYPLNNHILGEANKNYITGYVKTLDQLPRHCSFLESYFSQRTVT